MLLLSCGCEFCRVRANRSFTQIYGCCIIASTCRTHAASCLCVCCRLKSTYARFQKITFFFFLLSFIFGKSDEMKGRGGVVLDSSYLPWLPSLASSSDNLGEHRQTEHVLNEDHVAISSPTITSPPSLNPPSTLTPLKKYGGQERSSPKHFDLVSIWTLFQAVGFVKETQNTNALWE